LRGRLELYPELKRHQQRPLDEEEELLRQRLPGSDVEFEMGDICAHFSIRFRDWWTMGDYEKARYQSWWREKNLRDGLMQKASKEVGDIMAERRKKNDGDGKGRKWIDGILPWNRK
jgi:hypothetical protein